MMYNLNGGYMLKTLKNNSIIICDNDCKIQILKNLKKLVNIKFMTMSEFIKNYCFDYDEKTILYLIKNYNIKYEVALEYLNNLYYIEDKLYNEPKLDFLSKLKRELINNNLLIFNNKFKEYIKNKNIVIYNYMLKGEEKYILKNLDIEEINDKDKNYIPKIYELETLEEEVEFVVRYISNLINEGIPINKIKLTNVNNDYINIITKIFSFYNLKINKFNDIPIISTIVGKTFFNNLNQSIENAIKSIEQYKDTNIYNEIVDICNKYIWCDDYNDLKILIEYDLKHTFIENTLYTNMIEVVDYKTYLFSDEYVFMLGFNQGFIPLLKKDEDYISDIIKPDYMDSIVEINKREKENTIRCIKNIKNLIITYKNTSPFTKFYPSNLIDDLNIKSEKVSIDYSTSYSKLSDSIHLAVLIDNLIKFGTHESNLDLLMSNYDIPYNTYSNSFTKISKEKINNYLNSLSSFNLSYTSMDNYNRCAFRFYIDKILCLTKTKDTFTMDLGSIYHAVLEKIVYEDINVREFVYKYIIDNNIELKPSNKFFVEKAIENMEYLIEILKKQNKFSKLNKIETEKEVLVKLKEKVNFKGVIDKIVYDTFNGTTLAAIIDYKTYVKTPSLKYIDYGIGLQLPIYMYLTKQSLKNVRFVGFYLQNITLDNKSLEEKEESLKLIGFTNTDKDILEKFDSNYMDSSVIKGIKTNKDGSFSSNSLKYMLSDDNMDDIINLTKKKIDETISNIYNCNFDINPKFDKENLGCEFCDYSDLCFKKSKDYVKIKQSDKYNDEEEVI